MDLSATPKHKLRVIQSEHRPAEQFCVTLSTIRSVFMWLDLRVEISQAVR
jgi:hypothetical protein